MPHSVVSTNISLHFHTILISYSAIRRRRRRHRRWSKVFLLKTIKWINFIFFIALWNSLWLRLGTWNYSIAIWPNKHTHQCGWMNFSRLPRTLIPMSCDKKKGKTNFPLCVSAPAIQPFISQFIGEKRYAKLNDFIFSRSLRTKLNEHLKFWIVNTECMCSWAMKWANRSIIHTFSLLHDSRNNFAMLSKADVSRY